MEIRSVAILGVGAVGSYMLWGLWDTMQQPGMSLCVIAEGERKERYTRDGFVINDVTYRPAVKTAEEAKGVDLLIVCTKYNALRAALPQIAAAVDDRTMVMSLLNGIDSEEVIAEAIGMERILPSLIKVAAERVGNSVRFDAEGTIGVIYGEADLTRGTERVDALNALFGASEVKHRATDVIMSEMWTKFRLNVANNQPQAMVMCGAGAYRDSEHVKFLQTKLREEVDALAAAKGIDLSLSDKSSSWGSRIKDRAMYSTLQDLAAKRPTEVDVFAGAVVRIGAELGIPTPYNEFAYHMIKALEEKNAGLFDYE